MRLRPPRRRSSGSRSSLTRMFAWGLLGLAILSEVVGTTALRASNDASDTSRWLLIGLVAVGYGLSFWLLAIVLRHMQLGIAYAVWAGVGTAVTALVGVAMFGEPSTALKFGCIALIVAGVIGLNLSGTGH